MYASRDILCRRETLKMPRLSPIGTGAPALCGDRGSRAEIVPGAVFGGGALRLALKRESGWQERRLVVPFIRKRRRQIFRRAETVTSPGRRGDVTSRKGGNNPATWLKGGLAPSLFICMHRSGLRPGSQAA